MGRRACCEPRQPSHEGLADVSARLPSSLFCTFISIGAADGVDLERCWRELVKRLMREDRDLCRVELLAWFDYALRRHRRRYRLLYRQFRELLPHALGLVRRDGALMIDCGERAICNEPALCLKAYLICGKKWMKKELEKLAPGTPLSRVALVVLGEADVHEECDGPPCRQQPGGLEKRRETHGGKLRKN